MSPRALANQQRFEQSQRLGRVGRSFALLAATALPLITVGLLMMDQMFRPDAFVISQLKIVGSFNHLKPELIEETVKKHKNGNFFSIELDQIKTEIKKVDWVQNVDVRRQWPDTILVDVQEQRPLMRWQSKQWVNSDGEVVDVDYKATSDDVIELFGNERDSKKMLHQAAAWQQQMSRYGIALKSLTLSASQSFSLQAFVAGSEKNFELILGSEHVEQRLKRFLVLYDTQLRFTVRQINRVDARYPNGLAVDAIEFKPQPSDLVMSVPAGELQQQTNPQVGVFQ